MIDADAYNTRWEDEIYGQGAQLNLYPYPVYIGTFLSRYGKVPDRKLVRVLEVGSGAGNNLWFFAREGFDVSAMEGSESAVRFARQRLANEHLAADIRQGDFTTLPFENDSFDFVLDRAAITHNTKPAIRSILDEVRRVLKPGGTFFSQIFSTDHSELANAVDYADNSAGAFSQGYFANIGRTFFADRAVINDLYGSRFTLSKIELESHVDDESKYTSSYWNIFMER